MKVREYLMKLPENMEVTFLKARAREDAHSPFYHPEYQTTPLRCNWEWLQGSSPVLDSIILNDNQPSISWLSGADWNVDIKIGRAKCLLVISEDDMEKLTPNKEQREHMEKYIEGKLSL